jgi:phosphopantetheinyl transferase
LSSAPLIPEPISLGFEEEDVDVALLNATGLADVEAAAARFLTPAEHAERARLREPPRRLEWLCARICLKTLLLRRGWIDDPRDGEVVKDARGRPRLARLVAGGPDVRYACSLSHKEHLAGAAISRTPGLRIGVDIEALSPRLARLAAAFTHDRDVVLGDRSLDARLSSEARLAILWTLKEACSKVMGRGLAMSLLDVTCEEVAPGRHRITTAEGLELRGRHLAYEGYMVALCVGPDLWEVR